MAVLNDIFAAAFDELRRNHGIKTQKELARRMGVSEDTITRIMKGRTDVTEDIITKLQTASGCIFNLQWLRGKDPYHMLAVDLANVSTVDIETSSTKITKEEANIIDIYSHLIADLELIRRETKKELAEIRTIKSELQQAQQQLIEAAETFRHLNHQYNYPTVTTSKAAEESPTNN